jgi:hypothetical protein
MNKLKVCFVCIFLFSYSSELKADVIYMTQIEHGTQYHEAKNGSKVAEIFNFLNKKIELLHKLSYEACKGRKPNSLTDEEWQYLVNKYGPYIKNSNEDDEGEDYEWYAI